MVLGPDGVQVADCAIFHRRRSYDECAANAAMIAAAHELLEAVEMAKSRFETILETNPEISLDREIEICAEAVRKAKPA